MGMWMLRYPESMGALLKAKLGSQEFVGMKIMLTFVDDPLDTYQ